MADVESNINIDINTSDALSSLRLLQKEISSFHQVMSKTGAISGNNLKNMQQNLVNSINSTGQFSATLQKVTTTTESFTNALEKNKFSMGQYFKYAGASTQTFGRLFRNEFDTIEKVARERVKTLQTQYIKLGRDANGAMQAISVRPQVLDMKDLGTQTAMAAQKTQLFNQLMKQGSTELLNFGKNTQWAGRQLMVGFTIPLGIMGAAAAKEFKAIEDQVIRLERVYGDFTTTVGDTEKVTAQIRTLAGEFTKYGVAVSKTIGLAADAAAMGKTGADLVAQVAEANRLAVLGGVDQAQSLETTISMTNAFGVSADKLAGKINFLNAVENQTVTSIEDLTKAIPTAGPVVQQLGGSVEDLAFFMTAMKEGGIDAGEGANALKSGLASLINPTQEAIDQLNGFGINIQAIRDANAGDVAGMVKSLATELNGLSDLNRAQAIETMFGKFQFSRMSTLFQNVIAEGSQANRVLDLTTASAGELAALSQKELSKIEASPLYKFQGAIENFKAALAPVGEEFMKAVTPLINFGTDILNKFNEMSDGGKQFVVILTGAVAGIGPVLLMTFGLIANGVANIIKGFLFLKNIFTGVGNSTNVLTNQLNYMTTEQLNAEAVAVSLGQVHTNLIGTFNAEAASVRNLSAAYVSAIATQSQFMGPIVSGKGTKNVKKMASGGILKGPGTGTSDSIPAMLSNGEAVIPAEVVKKYPGMVAGLIAGKVMGFSEGTNPYDLVRAHLQGNINPSAKDVENFVPGFSKLTKKQKAGFDFQGGLTAELPRWVNENLKRSGGVSVGDFGSVWNAIDDKMLSSAIAAGLDPNDPAARKALKAIESKVGERAVKLAQAAGTAVTDPILEKATSEILSEASQLKGKQSEVSKQLQQRSQTPSSYRTNYSKQDIIDMIKSGEARVVKGEKGYNVVNSGGVKIGRFRSGSIGEAQAPKFLAGKMSADDLTVRGTSVEFSGGHASQKLRGTVTDESALSKSQLDASEATREDTKATKEKTRVTRKRVKIDKEIIQQEAQAVKDAKTKDPKRVAAGLKAAETRRRNALAAEQQLATQSSPSRLAGLGGKAGMIGMGLSGAMMAGSMMGGPIGEAIGAFSGPLMGASMALQMLPGPIGLVVAGLAAVAGVALTMKQKFDDAQRAAEDFAYSTGASSQALKTLSDFTGKTSAGDIMQQRRNAISDTFGASPDTPSFGQSFLESESGKQLKESVGKAFEQGATSSTVAKNISAQMATAVSSGILSATEATSIIQSLGADLKDTTFGINATAELTKLIGPNGEDLEKEPVKVRLDIMKQQKKTSSSSASSLQDLGIGAGGVMGGLAAGAAVGSIIPGVGTGLGAALGLAVGGVAELFTYYEKLGAASGAFASNTVIASQQSQEMLDSLQLEYETRIKNAKAAGDTAKADELAKEYADGRKAILEQSAKDQKAAADAYGNLNMEKQTSVIGSLDQQIKDMYSTGPLKAVAEQAISQIGGMTLDGSTVEFTLKTAVASGDIDPTTMNNVLGLLDSQGKSADIFANIITKVGAADADRLAQYATMMATQEDGVDLMVNFSSMGNDEINKTLDMVDKIREFGGNQQVVLDMVANGEDATAMLDGLQTKYNDIEQLTANGPITMEAVTIFDPSAMANLKENADWFNSLDALSQKYFLQHYVTIMATIDDSQVTEYLRKKYNVNKNDAKNTASYTQGMIRGGTQGTFTDAQRQAAAAELARQQTQAFLDANVLNAGNPPGGPGTASGGGGGGGSAPDLPTLAEQYQAALKLISNTEDDINKKYEKRLEALDEIAKAQEAISEQQRDQLDIADALTKGDIAAAARAVQASRQNAAKRALEQQKQAMDAARAAELANVTYNGYTRAWYEAQIRAIEASDNARIAAGQAKANGGLILGPGNGTSDSIPAMLSNGEYVIRAAAVRAIGVAQLERLNNIDRMGYAGGGKVASGRMLNLGRAKRFNTNNINTPSFATIGAADLDTSTIAGAAAPVMINNTTSGDKVYNYSVNVNAGNASDPNQIANAVMRQIRNVEQRRVRGNYING